MTCPDCDRTEDQECDCAALCIRCHDPYTLEPEHERPDHRMCWPCASAALSELLERREHRRARDPRDVCARCAGDGWRLYGSTATWRGGMGGCSMTEDVCDKCWGSGDRYHSGVDLRAIRDDDAERAAADAVDLIARSVGASMPSTHRAVAAIVDHLDKLANKRGAPAAPHLPELTRGLADVLRRAIGVREIS